MMLSIFTSKCSALAKTMLRYQWNEALIIRGEGGKKSEEDEKESERRYSSRLDLLPTIYKVDKIKAEMKIGVLKVVVPKGERKR
ncbi:hypothetical protein PTKIN_Ptkin04bG0208200 [Pterospermum kingtungense]